MSVIRFLKRAANKMKWPAPEAVGVPYWELRARLYGARSVLDLRHAPEDFDNVGKRQVNEIFPYLKLELNGRERVALDYGCGPGRFTRLLADVIQGEVIGIDPIKTLLDLAPRAPNCRYAISPPGHIALADSSVDLVWVCLVLGGIRSDLLAPTCREIVRVLKPNGLLFLVEGTDERNNSVHWTARTVQDYIKIFGEAIPLRHLHDYHDWGERVSLLAGRRAIS